MKIKVINGPNLNLLGLRYKNIYGEQNYQDLVEMIKTYGIDHHIEIDVFQSNHEGAIIDEIQQAYFDGFQAIVINPGAYTHYSIAIRDALEPLPLIKVEVHISNIYEREIFRQVSVIEEVVNKRIWGKGTKGYLEAIDYIINLQN